MAKKQQAVIELPSPAELERICKGLAALDAIVCEDWEDRCAYAREYFEAKLPVDAAAHVLGGKKLTSKLVASVSDGRTLGELKEDLAEIAY